MRSFRLARIAAQAELLRLRHLARRQAIRAALGAVAAVFVLAALAAGHVAGVMALAERVTPIQSVLIVGGIDLVIGIILALFAARDVPSEVEIEALELRQTVSKQLLETMLLATLLAGLRRVRSVRDLVTLVVTGIATMMAARR